MVRIQEQDPEMVVDYIESDLAFADRALDKGLDRIERIIEQELIA